MRLEFTLVRACYEIAVQYDIMYLNYSTMMRVTTFIHYRIMVLSRSNLVGKKQFCCEKNDQQTFQPTLWTYSCEKFFVCTKQLINIVKDADKKPPTTIIQICSKSPFYKQLMMRL